MSAIILIALCFALVMFPTLRCAASHPISLLHFGVLDLLDHFRHREYDRCGSGELVAYTGLFGKGKTLSAVHKVVGSYKQFNGKKVWCPRRGKLVTQRVKVISNVALSIPYEDFVSLEQIVLAAERNREYDDEHGTLTVTLVLGDEFSQKILVAGAVLQSHQVGVRPDNALVGGEGSSGEQGFHEQDHQVHGLLALGGGEGGGMEDHIFTVLLYL